MQNLRSIEIKQEFIRNIDKVRLNSSLDLIYDKLKINIKGQIFEHKKTVSSANIIYADIYKAYVKFNDDFEDI